MTSDSGGSNAVRKFKKAARRTLPAGRQDEVAEFAASLEDKRMLADLATGIAELSQRNDELRQSEARFRKLFDATYDAIFLVDPERGRIVDANQTACRMLGYAHDELVGLEIEDIHPYEMPKFRDFARRVAEYGQWQTHELTCRAKWGEFIPAELSATAIVHDGRPCVLILAHDLRQHRLAELGTAVGKISHDLRSILATAQLPSDHLALSADPEVRRVTPTLISTIDRAIALCTPTLAHGRVQEPPPRRTRFGLRELVDDVGTAVTLQEDERVVWRNELPAELEVSADRDQLFRVLLNLGRNASQAIAGEGEVRVRAAQQSDKVLVDVADTGPGLPEAVRADVFRPFAGSARAGGTGLGLAIARDLMRGHGGDITLLRSDPNGTTFRLELPDE